MTHDDYLILSELEQRINARINDEVRRIYESQSLLLARLGIVQEVLSRMVDAAITVDPELVAELRLHLEMLKNRGPHGVYLH